MEKLFKEMLSLYGDFAEKARQHREKVSLLQQNVERYEHSKVEELIAKENAAFNDYVEKQQKQAQAIARRIMEIAEQRNDDFDIGDLNGIFAYLSATQSRASHTIIEKQMQGFRGCQQAVEAVLAVAQNNDAPATVLGTIKAMFCNLDEISQKLEKNVYNVFNMLDDAKHAGEVLVLQAAKLGIDIENTITDNEGAAYIFRKFAGLI